MEFITKKTIESINDPYYKDRYNKYLKDVIDQIKLMDNINTTLEIGPYKSPLIIGGDLVDIKEYSKEYPIKIGNFYKHDCKVTPYPFKDKQYDLVIACQVLEHLGQSQVEVFKELSRISKRAIITLPYKWNKPCDIHHMIDEKIIDRWAHGLKPIFEKICYSNNGVRRILRVYNFDKNTNLEDNINLQEIADFQITNKLVQEQRKREKIEKELNDKNITLINELEQVQKQLAEEQKQKKEIEKELKDINRILKELLSSNSWKLTKPLRNFRSVFNNK